MSNKPSQVLQTLKGYALVIWSGARATFASLTNKRTRATRPSPSIKGREVLKTEPTPAAEVLTPQEPAQLTFEQEIKRISKHVREKLPDFGVRFHAARERIILDRIAELASKQYTQSRCFSQIMAEFTGLNSSTAHELMLRSKMYWSPELEARLSIENGARVEPVVVEATNKFSL